MKKVFFICTFTFLSFYTSCSHKQLDNKISIETATNGLMKNSFVPYPIYLTDKLESKNSLEKDYSAHVFLIHTGHLLKANLSKSENEKILTSISSLGFDLVNLSLEDFKIAELQGIHFSDYNQIFLNSSVIDLNSDTLATEKNVVSYVINNGIAFVGLSDRKVSDNLASEKYIIDDYVLSVLKIKKAILRASPPKTLRSFVIVHTIGSEIDEVMERLPPDFINSKAN